MKSWFEPLARSAHSAADFIPSSAEVESFESAVAMYSGAHSDGHSDSHSPDGEIRLTLQEVEERLAQAYERGLSEARAERPAHDPEDLRRVFAGLERAAVRIEGVAVREEHEWQRAAIEMGLQIAEHIVRSQIHVDPDAFLARIARALEGLGAGGGVKLEVSQEDFDWLEEVAEPELLGLRERFELSIESNAGIARGEFKATHGGAAIAGNVDAMISRFREELSDLPVGEWRVTQ